MATVGRRVGRLDVRLVRGDSERFGRPVASEVSGRTVKAVDLGAWSGVVELRSPDGSELWYSRACGEMTADGYAIADIPPSAFTERGVGGPADRPVEGHGHVAGRRDQAHAGLGYYALSD